MTQQDKDKSLTYFTMCQALIHVIDWDWRGNPANKQRVKSITKQQLVELEKVIEILLPKADYSEEGMIATGQFVDAADAMLQFYKIGIQMSRLDDTKRETLANQLRILLQSYEINA
jgi:hypothetical protein